MKIKRQQQQQHYKKQQQQQVDIPAVFQHKNSCGNGSEELYESAVTLTSTAATPAVGEKTANAKTNSSSNRLTQQQPHNRSQSERNCWKN